MNLAITQKILDEATKLKVFVLDKNRYLHLAKTLIEGESWIKHFIKTKEEREAIQDGVNALMYWFSVNRTNPLHG